MKNERREMKADPSRVSKLVETSGKGLSTTGSSSRKLTGKTGLVSGVQAKVASDSKTTPLSATPGTSLVVASVMRTDCSTVNIEQSMSPASATQHLPESSRLAAEAGMCFIVIVIIIGVNDCGLVGYSKLFVKESSFRCCNFQTMFITTMVIKHYPYH